MRRNIYLAAATFALILIGKINGLTQTKIPIVVYKDPKAAVERRITDLLRRMALEEKLG